MTIATSRPTHFRSESPPLKRCQPEVEDFDKLVIPHAPEELDPEDYPQLVSGCTQIGMTTGKVR